MVNPITIGSQKWWENPALLKGSDLNAILYGAKSRYYPEQFNWSETEQAMSPAQTVLMNDRSQDARGAFAWKNANTVQELLRQYYPNLTQDQLDDAAARAFSETSKGYQNNLSLGYNEMTSPDVIINAISGQLGVPLTPEQQQQLAGVRNQWAADAQAMEQAAYAQDRQENRNWNQDFLKAGLTTAGLVAGAGALHNAGLLGGGTAAPVAAPVAAPAAASPASLGGTASVGGNAASGLSVGTGASGLSAGSTGLGAGTGAMGAAGGSGISGSLYGTASNTLGSGLTHNLAAATLPSMGGAAGISGTIAGLGSVANGVITPAMLAEYGIGTTALVPGAVANTGLFGSTTSLLDKAANFVKDNPLKALQMANGVAAIGGALTQGSQDTGGTRTITIPPLGIGQGQPSTSTGLMSAPFVDYSGTMNDPGYLARMKSLLGG